MRKLFKGQKQAVDELLRNAANGRESRWIEEKGGLEEVLSRSLSSAVKKAADLQGNNLSEWKWETIIN